MKIYSHMPDLELVNLLKDGDSSAFTEIYSRYWPLLFITVRKMMEDDDGAQDVVQEIFSKLWERAPELDLSSSLSAYLYGAVKFQVFNLFRHERVKAASFEDLVNFLNEGHYQVDEHFRHQELVEAIEAEIATMPEKMREIFVLSRKEQLSHKNIALKLNIAESTVREQIKRALKRLKAKLGDGNFPLLLVLLYLKK